MILPKIKGEKKLKKIISVALVLSIIMGLFAGLGFSVSAAEYTDFTAVGQSAVGSLDGTGKDATRNLIGDKLPTSQYLYNTIENNHGIPTSATPATFEYETDTTNPRYLGNLTSKSNVTSQTSFFKSDVYCKYMWANYGADNKVSELINDETSRFAQINYALDGEATIDTFIFGDINSNHGGQFWQMPGHYKVIFSNTEAGLLDHSQAVAVIEVDETKNAEFKKNRHTVTLNTPVTARYVALRMICGLNAGSVGTAALSNMYMERFTFFGVFGNYTTPVIVPDSEASATATDIEGATLNGITASAVVSFAGNLDDSGKSPTAGVNLTTSASTTIGDQYYAFLGWYLGDTLVTDKATYSYAFTGNETDLDFVAKYKATYKPFNDYSVAGANAANLDGTGKDAAKSLIVNKTPNSAYVFNTITVDGRIAPTNGPMSFDANHSATAVLTSPTDFTSDGRLFPETMLAYTYDMFANWTERAGTGKITEILDNEDNQWVQINYNLDGEAAINTVIFGAMATSYSVQMPGHYKIILSDTEDGLMDYTKSKAVIDLNAKENATLKTSRHTVTLTNPVTAKYIGIRFICMFNDSSVGSVRQYNQMYSHRIKHLSVYGEYTNPADAEVTVETESGVPAALVSKADPVYEGVGDDNGKYVAGTQKITASATYEDKDNSLEYIFNGWYKGDDLVTANAEYIYDLKGDDVTFTAKYNVQPLVTKYIVVFKDGLGNTLASFKINENDFIDTTLVEQLVVNDIYGYKVLRDGEQKVIWSRSLEDPITADVTINSFFEAEEIYTDLTIYDTDSTTEIIFEGAKRYDTAINLERPTANSWVDAKGKVLIAGGSGTLYACGEKMDIYAKSKTAQAPEVVIVGKVNEEDKGFSVFAHINAENVTERGIIFASSTAGANIDFTFEHVNDDTEHKKFVVVEIDTLNAGLAMGQTEFMATLNYSNNPTRYARAYVKVGDTYYYSNVVVNK